MLEASGANIVESSFACMTEGSMPQIVTESDRFGQVAVEIHRSGNRSCDLRNLKSMGKTGAVMISLRRKKDLSFMLESSE